MLPDRVSNPGPLTYESGALPIAPCSLADAMFKIWLLGNDMDPSNRDLHVVVKVCASIYSITSRSVSWKYDIFKCHNSAAY